MEVTPLSFRLLMLEFILLVTQVQDSYTEKRDAVVIHVTPNKPQHFEYESVSFQCEGIDGSTELRGIRNTTEFKPPCVIKPTPTGVLCTFNMIYIADGGQYWCEDKRGERSNTVNITVTDGVVILVSPVLPVKEGNNVTLHCRHKANSTTRKADFFRDDTLVMTSPVGEMTIGSVSRSDEGLYKCRIPGIGTSPDNWLTIRASLVILESPVLPVKERYNVNLHCRQKINSSLSTADFYKNGLLIGSSSSGNMTIRGVSKSDEGLYKCRIADVGESPENWLAVRALHRETCVFSDNFILTLTLLRTVFTAVLVPLLLLLVGLLHCGKLTAKQR